MKSINVLIYTQEDFAYVQKLLKKYNKKCDSIINNKGHYVISIILEQSEPRWLNKDACEDNVEEHISYGNISVSELESYLIIELL